MLRFYGENGRPMRRLTIFYSNLKGCDRSAPGSGAKTAAKRSFYEHIKKAKMSVSLRSGAQIRLPRPV